MRRNFTTALALALSTFGWTNFTWADEPERRGPPPEVSDWNDNGWSLYVGGGGIYGPNWSGDDEYSAAVVPFLRVTKGDRFFASVQEGAGYAIIKNDNLNAGPLATLDFGRDEDGNNPFRVSGGDSTDLIGMGNISTTIALGAFADYKIGNFKFKAKAGKALGSHEGVTTELGLDFDKMVLGAGPPLFVTIGPRFKWADGNYNQAFYGITGTQALAAGLPQYEAKSGIISYGLGGSLIMPLSRDGLGITFFGSYDRLTGAAGESPLVILRGSKDQFFGGSALAYRF